MKIQFRTKEEANKAQREAFLELTGSERFEAFLKLSQEINSLFPNRAEKEDKGNFVIYKKGARELGN